MTINLDTMAQFTWDFGQHFLLETTEGFFVWSDPDYNGDNTIKPYKGNPSDFTAPGFCGRDKGYNSIRNKCGEDVIFMLSDKEGT